MSDYNVMDDHESSIGSEPYKVAPFSINPRPVHRLNQDSRLSKNSIGSIGDLKTHRVMNTKEMAQDF